MTRVVHIAPFGPTRAGIYEAARDMMVSDHLQGHDVHFVDSGIMVGDTMGQSLVGAVDHRGALAMETEHPDVAKTADVLVMHSGIPDIVVVKNQAPMIWIVHGRPLACFRSEQRGDVCLSYRLVPEVASWPRSKALVYFWPEYRPYWEGMIPPEKHVVFDFPPIDNERFHENGRIHIPGQDRVSGAIDDRKGRWNGLICDSWRDDIDIFEATHGAIEAAKANPGLKFHFYGMETGPDGKLRPCWEILLHRLRELNALGEVFGRMADMDEVYRGMDFLLSPHRIVTRCIGEALTCGTAVVAGQGCKVANRTARMDEPHDIAWAITDLLAEMTADPNVTKQEVLKNASKFDLQRFGLKMTDLYNRVLSGEAAVAA